MRAPDLQATAVRVVVGALGSLAVAAAVARSPLGAAGSCGALSKLRLPGATITLAESVDAGAFTSPVQLNADAIRALPSFCRIAATLKPTSESDIKIEVWLPASGWNGKLQAVGNGAFNGSISYAALMSAVMRGYAATSTDTGHTGGGASFALG